MGEKVARRLPPRVIAGALAQPPDPTPRAPFARRMAMPPKSPLSGARKPTSNRSSKMRRKRSASSIRSEDFSHQRRVHPPVRLYRGRGLGKRLDHLIVPPDRYTETAWIAESIKTENKISLETRRQRKDGSLIEVLLSTAPITLNGKKMARTLPIAISPSRSAPRS